MDRRTAFSCGAKWADNKPNAIDFAYLQSWYQDSIDSTKEPVWTDKHLEELFKDFDLIPKKDGSTERTKIEKHKTCDWQCNYESIGLTKEHIKRLNNAINILESVYEYTDAKYLKEIKDKLLEDKVVDIIINGEKNSEDIVIKT